MENHKSIYDLALHESTWAKMDPRSAEFPIMRVPGGWLYGWGEETTTFVPYNEEFKAKPE